MTDHLTVRPTYACVPNLLKERISNMSARKDEGPEACDRPEPPYTTAMNPLDLLELSTVLPFLVRTIQGESTSCDCCGTSAKVGDMTNMIRVQGDQSLLCWICPACLPEAKATNGDSVRRGCSLGDAEAENLLRMACGSFDSTVLKICNFQPFVRRRNFVERERARAAGKTIPDGAAVVVTKYDKTHLHRRVLQMPFPWRDDEWYAGPIAAREAMAFAEEIERGEAGVFGLGLTITPEAFERVQRAGRIEI